MGPEHSEKSSSSPPSAERTAALKPLRAAWRAAGDLRAPGSLFITFLWQVWNLWLQNSTTCWHARGTRLWPFHLGVARRQLLVPCLLPTCWALPMQQHKVLCFICGNRLKVLKWLKGKCYCHLLVDHYGCREVGNKGLWGRHKPSDLGRCMSSQEGVIFVHPGCVLESLSYSNKILNKHLKK